MDIYFLYPLLNILLVALPLSLIEISLEKSNGWGSGWSKDKWYARSVLEGTKIGNFLTKTTKMEMPLNYHLLVAYFLLPLIFILEYVFLPINFFLMLSAFVFVILVADILWFSLNWYFDSLTQLLKGPNGSIFWYQDWVKISKKKYLPRAYFAWLALAIALWLIALYLR